MAIGFDKYSINSEMMFGLPLTEATGSLVYDVAKAHHTMTISGATWSFLGNGFPTLDFTSGTPDFLVATGSATDIRLTSGNWTVLAWIKPSTLDTLDRMVMNKGTAAAGGWEFFVATAGSIKFVSFQAANTQTISSASEEVTTGSWFLVGATRDNTATTANAGLNKIFKNGKDITATDGGLVDPVNSATDFHIGVYSDTAARPFDGDIALPRIWCRKLEPREMNTIFETERHIFSV